MTITPTRPPVNLLDATLTREVVEVPTFARNDDGTLRVVATMLPLMSIAHVVGLDERGEPFGYRERVAPGAFQRAADNPSRVNLVWGHSEDFPNQLGRGMRFWEQRDCAMGEFKVARSIAERAREELVDKPVSISFVSLVPKAFTEYPDALVTREQIHLKHLGVVSAPAYAGAGVSELRAEQEAQAAQLISDQQARAAQAAAEQERRARFARTLQQSRSWRELTPDEEAFVREHLRAADPATPLDPADPADSPSA